MSLALQKVSSWHVLLHLKVLDGTGTLFSRGLVVIVPYCILSLLIALVLHSSEGMWFVIVCIQAC